MLTQMIALLALLAMVASLGSSSCVNYCANYCLNSDDDVILTDDAHHYAYCQGVCYDACNSCGSDSCFTYSGDAVYSCSCALATGAIVGFVFCLRSHL